MYIYIYIYPTIYSIQFKKNTCVGISRNIPIFVGWILWLSTAWSIQVASASVGWLHMLGQQISVGVLPRQGRSASKRRGIMGNFQSRSINHLWKIIYRWIIIYKSMHQLGGFDGKIIYKSRFLAEIPKWRFSSLGNPHRTPKTPWKNITSGSKQQISAGYWMGSISWGGPKQFHFAPPKRGLFWGGPTMGTPQSHGSTPQRKPDRKKTTTI
jgi:hypothetical protein